MLDAKLKGEGIDLEAPPEQVQTNVIDLMAALRRSIAETDQAPPERAPTPGKATKAAKVTPSKAQPAEKPSRKRAS